ncbi:MAG TPA: sugar phosphate nucleotidyltransferase, partial [Thermoanaerobaculia bacterium]|nr:sugar phosphate nucleotidyltransferase [Thermoanaerobaculia bacterium]
AERPPSRIILLGAQPTEPETEYGWIEAADAASPFGMTSAGPVCRVAGFREKPSPDEARAWLEKGSLWNTFVMVGRASIFSEAGRLALPRLHALLRSAAPLAERPSGSAVLEEAYRCAELANFSRAVLESYPSLLAVSKMPPVVWSDLGTPERVFRSLRRMGAMLPWLRSSPALRRRPDRT